MSTPRRRYSDDDDGRARRPFRDRSGGRRTPAELSPSDISAIREALVDWARRHPDPDEPVLGFAAGMELRPPELADHVAQGTEIGTRVLAIVTFSAARESVETVLDAFNRSNR